MTAHNLNAYATPNAQLVAEAIGRMTEELIRLNDNLESGRLNIRTHHQVCIAPPEGNYSMRQLEAIDGFVRSALETGALVLPSKEEETRS